MKTHEKGDSPVRCMANRYVHDIIKEAATLLLEMTRQDAQDCVIEIQIIHIECLLEMVRFNLQKPKPK